ncbi:Ni/Fe-hydrogenase cytochrome b subunit [Desulfovibrio aerotolerans]|uniref:Ni/Fe-hydrogenase cytochrome b subunit n=1 Tax=Solidesulfovibrio aerotolerans TaxID=295255 RepID=A0A7C9MDC5_9BACT|nr:Ni/Fe-hydrogenase cytochrome b subunit [Solidesulfovibrio aerotolerans]MYL81730.1 Ni/Fe-hydrogenase cytochrome b subunit [Solidesulfovibrio aerotolerans]
MSTENAKSGSLFTPWNIVAGLILAAGIVVTIMRFTMGLGSVTNLTDNNPWGIWIGFDLLCGVALAAGGYTTSAACYIFGFKRFHGAVRPAILTAFLGYAMVVFALNYDVGRPWRLVYPIFYQQGTTSILFEVGLCVFIYLTVLFLEYLPAALEWKRGFDKYRGILVKMTMGLTILGVILSTLHQSSLGALYLIAPSKLHPLWYTAYLPVMFFMSSMFAGLSMVIFEGTISHKHFHHKMDAEYNGGYEDLQLAFAKAAAWIMAGYLAMKIFGLSMDNRWQYLGTGYGVWWLVEVFGFVAMPCYCYAVAYRDRNLKLARIAAPWTVLGIVLNRFNISLVAFNWQLPSVDRYFPSFGEIVISLFVVTIGVLIFRFIVTRMPIFYVHPAYKDSSH